MGAPVLGSDEGVPFKRKPPNDGPSGNVPVKDAPERPDPSPSARLPDARPSRPLGTPHGLSSGRTPVDPPVKPTTTPKPRHTLFEGDAAAVELRSRLAKTRNGTLSVPPDASAPAIRVPVFGGVLRFAGIAMTAAAVAGAAGYLAGGVKLSFKPARIAAPSGEAGAPPALAVQLNASNRNAPLLVAQTDAVAGASAPRLAGNDTGAARAAQRPGPLAAPPLSPLPQPDASEIAARLKLGADLMAAGDIAAAR